jgi:S-adenosylmethionine:tRNA ribosyltransferase-isomerase
MKLSEFKFKIPKNLISEYPADPRSSAKMMVLDKKTGELEDKKVSDLVDLMKRGDCIVLNETKVFPAKFQGYKEKTNAEIEVMLLRELNKEDKIWDVLVEPARKVRIGNKIYFDDGKFYCEVIDNTTNRGRTVRFSYNGDLFNEIERIGKMPLPEYITRPAELEDKERYQTVFASDKFIASIAPPSSGLFLTQEMIDQMVDKGVRVAKIVMNIGLGIFEEVEVEDITKHRMYSEYFEISRENAEIINKSLKAKKNVYAIGTSVVRALENSVLTTGTVKPNKGWTDKFIYPNYEFKIATAMLTSFHPSATPSILCSCAFCNNDRELLMKIYKRAIKNEYNFHVFGDAFLMK